MVGLHPKIEQILEKNPNKITYSSTDNPDDNVGVDWAYYVLNKDNEVKVWVYAFNQWNLYDNETGEVNIPSPEPLGKWVEIPYRFYGVPESYANWYGALIEKERYTSGSIYPSNIIGSDKIYATTMANGHRLIATLYEWYEPENNRIIDLLEIGTPTLVFDPVSGTYDYEGFGGFMPYTYDGVFYDNKYTYNGVTYFVQESYAEYPDLTDPYAPQGVYIDEEGIWMPRQEAYTTKEIALDDFYRTHLTT